MAQETTGRPVKVPGPDHPITIEPHAGEVTVSVNGQQIAKSVHVMDLAEADYPVVHYVPADDVDMSVLEPSDHQTYCPFKGEASYFSIVPAGEAGVNAVWTYEEPYDAVNAIRGHVAFYADRVDLAV